VTYRPKIIYYIEAKQNQNTSCLPKESLLEEYAAFRCSFAPSFPAVATFSKIILTDTMGQGKFGHSKFDHELENIGVIENGLKKKRLDILYIDSRHPFSQLFHVRVINDCYSQGADPSPLPLRVTKAVRNDLKEEVTPLLPTVIGERDIAKP
jgi:hypothetical protein